MMRLAVMLAIAITLAVLFASWAFPTASPMVKWILIMLAAWVAFVVDAFSSP